MKKILLTVSILLCMITIGRVYSWVDFWTSINFEITEEENYFFKNDYIVVIGNTKMIKEEVGEVYYSQSFEQFEPKPTVQRSFTNVNRAQWVHEYKIAYSETHHVYPGIIFEMTNFSERMEDDVLINVSVQMEVERKILLIPLKESFSGDIQFRSRWNIM